MGSLVTDLFKDAGPIGVIIFAGLLFYVIADMIKKSNRIDELLKQLGAISSDIHNVKNIMQAEKNMGFIIQRDVEELKKLFGDFSHRVVRLETWIRLKDLEDDQGR